MGTTRTGCNRRIVVVVVVVVVIIVVVFVVRVMRGHGVVACIWLVTFLTHNVSDG